MIRCFTALVTQFTNVAKKKTDPLILALFAILAFLLKKISSNTLF